MPVPECPGVRQQQQVVGDQIGIGCLQHAGINTVADGLAQGFTGFDLQLFDPLASGVVQGLALAVGEQRGVAMAVDHPAVGAEGGGQAPDRVRPGRGDRRPRSPR